MPVELQLRFDAADQVALALNLVRTATDKRSIKSRRELAGWNPNYLNATLSSRPA